MNNTSSTPAFTTPGYEDLELSTQILVGEALRRGATIDVLDPAESFIAIHFQGRTEYVKQTTRTSLDTYIAALIMENKLVSKQLVHKAGITVPRGRVYRSRKAALADRTWSVGRAVVVKPNTTNFGIAVTILDAQHSEQAFITALDTAFREDQTVLVEEFISGKEYRFLVLGDRVNAVLERVPANVCGNGHQTITELVQEKNSDPLRGTGYVTPLEKIQLAAEEARFLAEQGRDFNTIPAKGELVYLRKNSNISTGGDSIDRTDDIHPGYKELAVKATQAAGVVLNGADIVIKDINQAPEPETYAVIELNFNPAIHIHCFPYQGKNRHPEQEILDLLGIC
ncbi:MAG: bifunctional glutamate--cysteine ligase/glutathione synthetase [Deltaproteobacteria bacterium]|nr:MAG: bifunctional glutamate--cysteine ligase/glutathione synthetase [Deltaproteobacteria bacterium]